MIITRTIDVSCLELNNFLKNMLLEDIKSATGKNIKINDIGHGYKYRKELKNKMGKAGKVNVYIDEFVDNRYAASFESAQGVNHLKYNYESINDNQTKITYSEDYVVSTSSKKWNFSLMSILFKHSNKKRVILMLGQIEQYIIENR